jgi:pyruvate dehydrogenase E2 component (dihydrolipoamide acetyltransferase)
MAYPIQIPRLGWSMEEGVFVEWLKADGDTIEPGDLLFNLEGEKAIQEIESIDSGVLRIPENAPSEGDTVLVGQVIGWLCKPGENPPAELPTGELQADAAAAGRPPGPTDALANSADDSVANPAPTSTSRPASSPRARRIAAELGIDWTTLTGSGRNGRIRECDVRVAADSDTADSHPPAKPAKPATATTASIRGVIADRLLAAAQTTAPVTLTTTADAQALVSLRQQFQATAGDQPAVGYNEILLKLTAIVLQQHPQLRSQWTDSGPQPPAADDAIDIGLAVDTQQGLLVPVVRNPGSETLKGLQQSVMGLVERARLGELSIDEMTGGVFTITNLGAHGVDAFTPILNLPQAAILGVGRVRAVPVVLGEDIVAGQQLSLSLTFDHRVLDGAPAARFLADLVQAIENPAAMLAG